MTDIKIRVIDCHVTFFHKKKGWLFLMLQRAQDIIYPNIWQCVTGKIKENEKPFATAIREVKEETNLKATNMWVVDQVNTFYDANYDTMNLIPIFGVQVKSQDVQLSVEHVQYKWCSINESLKLYTWNMQKKGCKTFYDMLIENDKRLKLSKIDL